MSGFFTMRLRKRHGLDFSGRVPFSKNRRYDISYPIEQYDGLTIDKTEEEQLEAEALQHKHSQRYHRLNDMLISAKNAESLVQKAIWLNKELRYRGVNINGFSKPLLFSEALKIKKYRGNVFKMFNNEVDRLKEMFRESKNYLFPSKSSA